ncbi:MAG: permease, partial [Clostridia bacterium]|nr:permease [Clostridia bacterium]
MKKFIVLIKRYRLFIIMLIINSALLVINPDVGQKSFSLTWKNTLEMLAVIPPIFILLGLLDTWVKREVMIKYMGD